MENNQCEDYLEEVTSEIIEFSNYSLKMVISFDLSPLISPVKSKTKQSYKLKLDPSLSLKEGTKRERREPKKFVAKTTESKENSESEDVLEDNLDYF